MDLLLRSSRRSGSTNSRIEIEAEPLHVGYFDFTEAEELNEIDADALHVCFSDFKVADEVGSFERDACVLLLLNETLREEVGVSMIDAVSEIAMERVNIGDAVKLMEGDGEGDREVEGLRVVVFVTVRVVFKVRDLEAELANLECVTSVESVPV